MKGTAQPDVAGSYKYERRDETEECEINKRKNTDTIICKMHAGKQDRIDDDTYYDVIASRSRDKKITSADDLLRITLDQPADYQKNER